MAYLKEDMVYTDYKWTTPAGTGIPTIILGSNTNELNREEGYEMLYFINSLAITWFLGDHNIASFRALESIIRHEVPSWLMTYGGIRSWIANKYKLSIFRPKPLIKYPRFIKSH